MAKRDRIRMPASFGGIVRYFDEEYKSRFMIKPEQVVALCCIVAVTIIILYVYGRGIFGF